MSSFTPTTDLSDAHPDAQVLAPVFHDFGGRARFSGQAVTLRVSENNPLVRSTLQTPGHGKVLVVDGGGSLNCALLGGNLGQFGVENGWEGVIVNGCVRDTAELRARTWACGRWPPTPGAVARPTRARPMWPCRSRA